MVMTEDEPVTEPRVGITEYLSKDVPGFRGILKHRYSDFIVNEVDLRGQTVRLRETQLPKLESVSKKTQALEYKSYSELPDDVKALLSPLTWSRCMQMSKKYSGDAVKPSEKESIRIDVTSRDKGSRRLIHDIVKTNFPNLNSNTEEQGEGKFIVVSYIQSSNRRNEWPSHRPQFLHFTFLKKNLDTFYALSVLSKRLQKKPGFFSVAGTKDKRGITSQRVSARFTKAETIFRAITLMKGNAMLAGDYTYEKEPLRLGDLSGNHFKIVLRDVNKPLSDFLPALETLRDSGFINYFGLQRFGTSRVLTSSVGLYAIKGDWEGVIESILRPRGHEKPHLERARRVWSETKDPVKAMKVLNALGRDTIEYTILKGLSKNPSDYVGALGRLGRSMKSLYTHSYQSLVWNEMVSKRIQKFGTDVLLGDLVQVGDPPRKPTKNKSKKDQKSTKNGDENGEETDSTSKDEEQNEEEDSFDYSSHIKKVDESNIKDFTIYDVVMTQPGHDVYLPDNEIKSWYETRLSQDGLKLTDLKNSVKDFDLPGDYRKIIFRPKDVSWRICGYSSHDSNLVLSDDDLLQGNPPIEDEGDEGKFKALILEFTLPTASYATMALREITKEDTSINVQSNMTNNVKGKRDAETPLEKAGEPKKAKMDSTNMVEGVAV